VRVVSRAEEGEDGAAWKARPLPVGCAKRSAAHRHHGGPPRCLTGETCPGIGVNGYERIDGASLEGVSHAKAPRTASEQIDLGFFDRMNRIYRMSRRVDDTCIVILSIL